MSLFIKLQTREDWFIYFANRWCLQQSADAEQLALWYLFLHLAFDKEPTHEVN